MEDRYRLVFRGEVLDGQHAAVVKKKLGLALKLEGPRLDELFKGRPVVIKRDTDTATAARYQAAFKAAGARLRVLPVAGRTPAPAPPVEASSAASRDAAGVDTQSSEPDADAAFSLRPRGADMLDPSERPKPRVVQVDVSHLSLAAPGVRLGADTQSPAPVAPDTSHFTLAEPGADLGGAERIETLEVTLDPDWEVAQPGARLGGESKPVSPAVDLSRIHFDVAPRGADLGQKKAPPPPPAPDTSHLKLT